MTAESIEWERIILVPVILSQKLINITYSSVNTMIMENTMNSKPCPICGEVGISEDLDMCMSCQKASRSSWGQIAKNLFEAPPFARIGIIGTLTIFWSIVLTLAFVACPILCIGGVVAGTFICLCSIIQGVINIIIWPFAWFRLRKKMKDLEDA